MTPLAASSSSTHGRVRLRPASLPIGAPDSLSTSPTSLARALVTGGSGQLGTAFRRILPEASYPPRTELDLSKPDDIPRYLTAARPEAIINCAAYTAVDRAEEEQDLAVRINGESVGVMAHYAADAGIPFVTFSTDYVFDGTATEPYVESDQPHPVNAYGRSKLVGERSALASHPGALVIRSSWVISGTHPNFVATMLRLAAESDTVRVVADQTGCPTCVDDLAPATLTAMQLGVSGLLHLTNQGATTWYELARESLAAAGLDPGKIQPITTAEYPTPAPRPAYSVLDSERREVLGIDPLPGWRDSLPKVVSGLRSRP